MIENPEDAAFRAGVNHAVKTIRVAQEPHIEYVRKTGHSLTAKELERALDAAELDRERMAVGE